MASAAEQLKVVKVQRNAWVLQGLRCNVDLMVDNRASIVQTVGKASFTKTKAVIEVSIAAVLPLLG